MNLLDPRFKYVPAVATDVSKTWERFGFSTQANEERRAQNRAPAAPLARHARSAVLLLCASTLVECAELPAPRQHAEPGLGAHYSKVQSPVFFHQTNDSDPTGAIAAE